MPVLPFSLLVLHISAMVCMNYSCVCGFERKYCASPRFLIPVEPSEGFKQERRWPGAAGASWQCLSWRSALVGEKVTEELRWRACRVDDRW